MSRRGPGWPTVLALVLVAAGLSVFDPLQLLALPLALLFLALPPRRPGMVVVAVGLLAVVFVAPRSGVWEVERGWSLLVSAWFVLAVVAWPGRPFVQRGLAAVAAAAATGAALLVATGGWRGLDWTVRSRFQEAASVMAEAFPMTGVEADEVVRRAAELPAELFPGLLAVGSLAALAVGWWGYTRVAERGEPLGRLPEFRFPDPLVWVLIAGLLLVIASPAPWATRGGGNLLFVMGSLYVLRGLAVTVALVGSQGVTLAVLGLVGLLLWPVMMAGTLVVGVLDTWFDLRAALRAAGDEG